MSVPEGQEGYHDDDVLAVGIAWQVRRRAFGRVRRRSGDGGGSRMTPSVSPETMTRLLTCLDADSTQAARAVGCEVGDRLAPTLLARRSGVARS